MWTKRVSGFIHWWNSTITESSDVPTPQVYWFHSHSWVSGVYRLERYGALVQQQGRGDPWQRKQVVRERCKGSYLGESGEANVESERWFAVSAITRLGPKPTGSSEPSLTWQISRPWGSKWRYGLLTSAQSHLERRAWCSFAWWSQQRLVKRRVHRKL